MSDRHECDEDFEQDESVWDAVERMSELKDEEEEEES